ncbi:hypothetical protein OGAPHI_007307 [Ogataea philodendri]|uniref:Uncharacterized protein n=1 Tax=Ogataea philodendri TaxID=1378263 RepID=A0A9P8NVP5_9ASCO|nr:uncharacterized protein OGAPHI_007307 [Ogataea philodendri]KAH3660102.1 hypothetical protein OGAPHI_007307 [Ogataea philodendri]
MTEAHSGMQPDVGVAATSPEIIPEHRPTAEKWWLMRKSSKHQRNVVRSEVDHQMLTALSEKIRNNKASKTRQDLDRATPSVIKNPPVMGPAVWTPNPICDRAVDQGQPQEREHHGR